MGFSGDLQNLYEIRDSDEEELNDSSTSNGRIDKKESQSDKHVLEYSKNNNSNYDCSSNGNDTDEHDGKQKEKTATKNCDDESPLKMNLARGEGNISSSDDDSDWDWESHEFDQLEIDLARLDQDAEQVEWATNRIAACNMDWNLVKCEDLMVLAKSFAPPGGSIYRITIYLSDFGATRLAEEDKYGPKLQLSKPIEKYDSEEIDDETRLAMRKYQVEQLRYYYAVIECDSVETAMTIYDQCDGYQFESSDLKMDLRFVPEGMDFDKERIKEELSEEDVNISKYKSKEKVSLCKMFLLAIPLSFKFHITLTIIVLYKAQIGGDPNECANSLG
ncbi:hypothetical protein DICVIV_05477 [Dictyocaulus viviparus]|uniref:ESF1 RRM domain-containing protein n=1 Tax=Dictyocaulus viviparus TaxID=29172 RepID=A0A0D8XX87_DICVI|nr:hypothetical protein DICVIV_05477 [Dictyocaulus viviparus]